MEQYPIPKIDWSCTAPYDYPKMLAVLKRAEKHHLWTGIGESYGLQLGMGLCRAVAFAGEALYDLDGKGYYSAADTLMNLISRSLGGFTFYDSWLAGMHDMRLTDCQKQNARREWLLDMIKTLEERMENEQPVNPDAATAET